MNEDKEIGTWEKRLTGIKAENSEHRIISVVEYWLNKRDGRMLVIFDKAGAPCYWVRVYDFRKGEVISGLKDIIGKFEVSQDEGELIGEKYSHLYSAKDKAMEYLKNE